MSRDLRIEAFHPGIIDAVQTHRQFPVNNIIFTEIDGRYLSDPISEKEVEMFYGAAGFVLVRAKAPYEHAGDLGNEGITPFLDTSTPPPPDPEPKLERAHLEAQTDDGLAKFVVAKGYNVPEDVANQGREALIDWLLEMEKNPVNASTNPNTGPKTTPDPTLESLTVPALRQKAQALGVSTKGSKADLVARIAAKGA